MVGSGWCSDIIFWIIVSNDMNNKYNEIEETLRNDTVEKFKEILKEEISKVNGKLEGKIHQLLSR